MNEDKSSSSGSTLDTLPESSGSDLSEEAEEHYAQLVQLCKATCQMAGFSAENIDGSGSEEDKYETERFERLIGKALGHAMEIDDEFYRSAALHPIADAFSSVGQYDRAEEIIAQIGVDFISQQAAEFLQQSRNA